jgi:hypothetical protein
MTPIEIIAARYDAYPQEREFSWYINHHFLHGFVYSTPDFFIMGRHVNSTATEAEICDPCCLFAKDNSDCWYIHAMAGDMKKAFSIMPWELPMFAWERILAGHRELRLYKLDRIRHLCLGSL